MIKYFLYFLYLVALLSSYQFFTSCANPASPTGGPRDTIPPLRINTVPEHKSINYQGNSVLMEYDERLKTDKLKDQLIITPLTESDYDYNVKKNTIKLTFEDPFQDSTTYTLNFRESIQDITEGNPTKDNKFTFSTGTFIDSMSITGYVKELLTYDTLENVVVGLYNALDTITIFNGSPYYFTELEEDGSFLIENIKNGQYLLYAFVDENKNLKLETNNESYGFALDTLNLDTGMVSKNIDLINLDLTELKTITAIASGQYFEINFNKYIVDYDFSTINSNHEIYTNRSKQNKSIRFYNNFSDIDSLLVAFSASDSIKNIYQDSVYVKFSESRRKKDEFSIKVQPEDNQSIEPTLKVELKFNKPVITTNTDSIYVQFDTTVVATVHDSLLIWNKWQDELTFQIEIDKTKADTILARRIRSEQIKQDSVEAEQQDAQVKQQISRKTDEETPKINTGLQLYFGTGSFYSADLDTSTVLTYNYNFLEPSDYGIQQVSCKTEYQSYLLQLVTEKFEIIREVINQKSVVFKNIKPGKYKIRVLIDENNDGQWSPGNMIKQIEPEPVYIYPEVLVIRADWQTTLDITF